MAVYIGLVVILLLETTLLGTSAANTIGEKCDPGATRCDTIGRYLNECNADRAWARSADCVAEGSLCINGRCASHLNASRNTRVGCNVSNTYDCNEDCSAVIYCNNIYAEIILDVCGDKTYCVDTGNLSSDSERFICGTEADGDLKCGGEDVPQRCSSPGAYPLVGDCTKYMECTGNARGEIHTCGSGKQFNSCTQTCENEYLSNYVCENLHPECDRIYENFVNPMNPSLYYKCDDKKIPFWNKCNKGFYVPQLDTCIGDDTICASTPGHGQCDGVGNYPIPGTNCSYLKCSADGICLSNYAFNSTTRKCEYTRGACIS